MVKKKQDKKLNNKEKKNDTKSVVKNKSKSSQKKTNRLKNFFNWLRNWFSNAFAWLKAKPVRWIGAAVLLIAIIVIVITNMQSSAASQNGYQTVEVERGDLIAIVGATGIVEANQTVELSWETIGRVESVEVGINDQVESGQILADLADNTLPQEIILAQADLVDANRVLEDLINSNTESAEAYANLLEAEQDLRDEEDDRDQWNYKDVDIDQVNEARADFIAKEEELKIYYSAYEALSDLPSDDPDRMAAYEEYKEYKLIRDKSLRALNYILGKAYGQQVAEDFAAYDIAEAKLEDAQREWDRVKNGPNADDISAAEAKVEAAEATVSMGWVEAPFDGTVTQAYPKVGDQVSAGTEAFRIDDLSQLYVDLEISEVDINRVSIGQQAELTFDAIPGETYTGEVTKVSTVGVDTGSGVDFTVTLKIIDPDDNVRPGMTAAVNIIVSQIEDVLILPTRAVRLENNQRIVYVLNGNMLETVKITIGASSDTEVEIFEGDVEEGDLIVLNPPAPIVNFGAE